MHGPTWFSNRVRTAGVAVRRCCHNAIAAVAFTTLAGGLSGMTAATADTPDDPRSVPEPRSGKIDRSCFGAPGSTPGRERRSALGNIQRTCRSWHFLSNSCPTGATQGGRLFVAGAGQGPVCAIRWNTRFAGRKGSGFRRGAVKEFVRARRRCILCRFCSPEADSGVVHLRSLRGCPRTASRSVTAITRAARTISNGQGRATRPFGLEGIRRTQAPHCVNGIRLPGWTAATRRPT